ncbi:MAG: hypothetical protein ACP5NC_02125 [Nitrososphaeria archaeon]
MLSSFYPEQEKTLKNLLQGPYNRGLSTMARAEQQNALPEIGETLELTTAHSQVLQDVLRRLDTAFKNFFEGGRIHLYIKKQISNMTYHRGRRHGRHYNASGDFEC